MSCGVLARLLRLRLVRPESRRGGPRGASCGPTPSSLQHSSGCAPGASWVPAGRAQPDRPSRRGPVPRRRRPLNLRDRLGPASAARRGPSVQAPRAGASSMPWSPFHGPSGVWGPTAPVPGCPCRVTRRPTDGPFPLGPSRRAPWADATPSGPGRREVTWGRQGLGSVGPKSGSGGEETGGGPRVGRARSWPLAGPHCDGRPSLPVALLYFASSTATAHPTLAALSSRRLRDARVCAEWTPPPEARGERRDATTPTPAAPTPTTAQA